MTDLAIADYNESVEYDELSIQSLLLSSKAAGEKYKGQMTAGIQIGSAVGSLLGNQYG